jgi:hypothetical protein
MACGWTALLIYTLASRMGTGRPASELKHLVEDKVLRPSRVAEPG